jgi:endoglucanase
MHVTGAARIMTHNRQIYARFLVVVAAVLLLAASGARADSAADSTAFRRGIGIAHTWGWAPLEPPPSHSYDIKSLMARAQSMSDDELRRLRQTGFDFVRLGVDPGPFLQTQGGQRDDLDRILKHSVAQILSADLSVIVDFHPGDQNPDYGSPQLTAGVNTVKFQAYLKLLARTARLLADLHSQRVALEIMNEPALPAAEWQPLLDAAYAAIRRAAPNLLVVLDGGLEGMPQGTMALRTSEFEQDLAVLYTFHYYDPYQFTHQGASWNAARYLADVPYPALARPIEDSQQASARAIDAMALSKANKWIARLDAGYRLERYRQSAFGRENVLSAFNEIGRWAERRHIPAQRILLGEFGARRATLPDGSERTAERAQWFRDVREAAEAHGFIWAVWAYRGAGDFALFEGKAREASEPAVIEALGLTANRDESRAPILGAESRKQIQGMSQ